MCAVNFLSTVVLFGGMIVSLNQLMVDLGSGILTMSLLLWSYSGETGPKPPKYSRAISTGRLSSTSIGPIFSYTKGF